jgi:hypothetical protein
MTYPGSIGIEYNAKLRTHQTKRLHWPQLGCICYQKLYTLLLCFSSAFQVPWSECGLMVLNCLLHCAF